MNRDVFTLIDILGTAAFSISGVFAAMEKKLDIFGILVIAFITAIGGGTIRDMMIGHLPVSWIRSGDHSLVIFTSAVTAILFYNLIKNYTSTLLIFDSIGLGFFTVVGIHKGLEYGASPGFCITLGTITACFGGLVRDIILNQIPHIFQKEIYATACIFGGILFFVFRRLELGPDILDATCIIVIVSIRIIAVRYKWSLPAIYRSDKSA